VFQERRRLLRRSADRELHQQLALHRDPRAAVQNSDENRSRRRRAIRHHCAVSISMRVGFASGGSEKMDYHDHAVKGRILDLSPTGCAIFTREMISIGAELGLVVHLDTGAHIAARGIVRWSKGVAAREGFASGVEFAKLNAKDAGLIERFLSELDENIGL